MRQANGGRGVLARALVSAFIVALALITVVVVQRRRGHKTPTSQATAMANMPGMAGMPAVAKPPSAGSNAVTAGGVTLSEAEQRELGVTFGTVAIRRLASDTRATGIVTFDETLISQVAPRFSGFVERLHVNATGQPVWRGQPLVDIYSPDVLAAEQDLLGAAKLERQIGQSAVPGVPSTTTDLVAAARQRLELWEIAPAQIDEVLRTGVARRSFTLYSPATGVIVTKDVVEGQSVNVGQALYTIAGLSDVWIDTQVPESDAAAARVGAHARIEVTGLPDRVLEGRVAYVYPVLDSASRAVRARVVVSNPDRLLKPGMYAAVQLEGVNRSALTVPTSALLRTGTRIIVFVDAGKGRLIPTEIQVGQTAGDYTEVLAGIAAGQRVATSAQFLLDSESNLGEVMRSMMSQVPSGARQP